MWKNIFINSKIHFYFFLEFCPAQCNEDQKLCNAETDPWTGEIIAAEYCIPAYSDKTNHCINHCTVICHGKDEILCPGKIDPATGCKTEDRCYSGSMFLSYTGCPLNVIFDKFQIF